MMPIPQFKVKSAPNWDEIGEYLKFKDADYVRFAEIIVDGMIQRTRNEQVTADGRPLSKNSRWWTAQKLRKGSRGALQSLVDSGKLTEATTYQVVLSEGVQLQLTPDYTEIH